MYLYAVLHLLPCSTVYMSTRCALVVLYICLPVVNAHGWLNLSLNVLHHLVAAPSFTYDMILYIYVRSKADDMASLI